MAKRRFERIRARLQDTYQQDGETYVQELLGGEEAAATIPAAGAALQGEQRAEAAARALAALKAGDPSAPYALIEMASDPRVVSGLLEAAGSVRSAVLANVAHVLSHARVEAAVPILAQRMADLIADPRTFTETEGTNWRAVAVSSLAGALLNLAPEGAGSAEALVRLLDHPNAADRRTAAAAAAEAMQRELPAEIEGRLGRELQRLLQGADPEMFGAIAAGLAKSKPELVRERCEQMLLSGDLQLRTIAAAVLVKLREARAMEVMAGHLARESDLRLACTIANRIGKRAPEPLRLNLARRALADDSPSLRYHGVGLLAAVAPQQRRSLAEEALVDEPDEFLRSRLEEMARTPA